MTHRRTPTGVRTPDGQPGALDDAGRLLLLIGSVVLGLLLSWTALQLVADLVGWDRLIAGLIGGVLMLIGECVVIIICGSIVANPRRRTPFL